MTEEGVELSGHPDFRWPVTLLYVLPFLVCACWVIWHYIVRPTYCESSVSVEIVKMKPDVCSLYFHVIKGVLAPLDEWMYVTSIWQSFHIWLCWERHR